MSCSKCADIFRSLPTMISRTFTDQQVSVVVSIDKKVLEVCYDPCETGLYTVTLLNVIRKAPANVINTFSTPFFGSCTSMTFVVRRLVDVKSAVLPVFPHSFFYSFFPALLFCLVVLRYLADPTCSALPCPSPLSSFCLLL